MITEPTVFILGAGASVPYGFPTGEKLRERLLELAPTSNYQHLFELCGQEISELHGFTEAFRKSGTSSIDAFLEHRTEFLTIGKIAISIAIIECENENNLHVGDWYRYIFSKMNTTFEEFKQNKLSILTFNYDRSFEHFLFTALKNLYGKSDQECKDAVESIPIIHLHGKVCALPWQGGDRPYEPYNPDQLVNNPNARLWLNEGVEGIKIIHEGSIKPSEEFDKAQELMLAAKRMYILGFGYHPKNVERLRMDDIIKANLHQALGTSYHLTHNERIEIQDVLLQTKFSLTVDNARHLPIMDFLREHVLLR